MKNISRQIYFQSRICKIILEFCGIETKITVTKVIFAVFSELCVYSTRSNQVTVIIIFFNVLLIVVY